MAMEKGRLKEAIKVFPFWLPAYPLPAIVEMESFYYFNGKRILFIIFISLNGNRDL